MVVEQNKKNICKAFQNVLNKRPSSRRNNLHKDNKDVFGFLHVFRMFVYLPQLGLVEDMQAKNQRLHVVWLATSFLSPS